MEQLEKLKAWLMAFPQWGETPPAVDCTGAVPGDCALFPQGVQELENRRDILGGNHRRLRQVFLLRRTAPRGGPAARWLEDLRRWVTENDANQPVFGDGQVFSAQAGRLIAAAPTGLGTYELRLIFEYDQED